MAFPCLNDSPTTIARIFLVFFMILNAVLFFVTFIVGLIGPTYKKSMVILKSFVTILSIFGFFSNVFGIMGSFYIVDQKHWKRILFFASAAVQIALVPYLFYFSAYSFIQKSILEFYVLDEVYKSDFVIKLKTYLSIFYANGFLLALCCAFMLIAIIFSVALSGKLFAKNVFTISALMTHTMLIFVIFLQILVQDIFPAATNPFTAYLTVFGYGFLSAIVIIGVFCLVLGFITLFPLKNHPSLRNTLLIVNMFAVIFGVAFFVSYSIVDCSVVARDRQVDSDPDDHLDQYYLNNYNYNFCQDNLFDGFDECVESLNSKQKVDHIYRIYSHHIVTNIAVYAIYAVLVLTFILVCSILRAVRVLTFTREWSSSTMPSPSASDSDSPSSASSSSSTSSSSAAAFAFGQQPPGTSVPSESSWDADSLNISSAGTETGLRPVSMGTGTGKSMCIKGGMSGRGGSGEEEGSKYNTIHKPKTMFVPVPVPVPMGVMSSFSPSSPMPPVAAATAISSSSSAFIQELFDGD